MTRALAWIGACLLLATVIGLALADDGMAGCQTSLSFDVCHAALY